MNDVKSTNPNDKQFIDNIYKSVLLCVKSSNGLPVDGTDYNFHVKYDENFANTVNTISKSIHTLIYSIWLQNNMIKQGKTGRNHKLFHKDETDLSMLLEDKLDDRDTEGFFKVTEFVDRLLEETEHFLNINEIKADGNLSIEKLDNTHHSETLNGISPSTNNIQLHLNEDGTKTNEINSLKLKKDLELDDSTHIHPFEEKLSNLTYPSWVLEEDKNEYDFVSVDQAKYQYISTKEKLIDCINELKDPEQNIIAIDLEAHSYHSYLGFLCLMQISIPDKDFIIDVMSLKKELGELNVVFTDPTKLKVLHGSDHDIMWLQRDLGLYIVNMFDTGQASRVLGFPRFSLAYLLNKYVGLNVDKAFQLADWRVRPLPSPMIYYARQDTRYLIPVYQKLKKELLRVSTSGSNLLHHVLNRSKNICLQIYKKPVWSKIDAERLFERLVKNGDLGFTTHMQKKIFSALHQWRDETAKKHDESTAFVLPNQILARIAKNMPSTANLLLQTCAPIPPLVRKYAHEVSVIISNVRNEASTASTIKKESRKRSSKRSQSILSIISNKNDTIIEPLTKLCLMTGWNQFSNKLRKVKHEDSSTKTDRLLIGSSIENSSQTNDVKSKIINTIQQEEFAVMETNIMNEIPNGTNLIGNDDVKRLILKNTEEIDDSLPLSIVNTYNQFTQKKKRKGQDSDNTNKKIKSCISPEKTNSIETISLNKKDHIPNISVLDYKDSSEILNPVSLVQNAVETTKKNKQRKKFLARS